MLIEEEILGGDAPNYAQKSSMPQAELEEKSKAIIDGCYKSFLDSDFNTRLTQILPQIEQK